MIYFSDLPRLLQFQLMLAFAWMDSDRKTALNILSWVRNTTVEAPETYNIYVQSTTLLGRLGKNFPKPFCQLTTANTLVL